MGLALHSGGVLVLPLVAIQWILLQVYKFKFDLVNFLWILRQSVCL